MRLVNLIFILLYFVVAETSAYDEGTRITWDFKTRQRVAWGGYPRAATLLNGDVILTVGNWDGGISLYKSTDNATNWTEFKAHHGNVSVFDARPKKDDKGYGWANAHFIQRSNGHFMLSYNARKKVMTSNLPYQIRILKSANEGNVWYDEAIVYNASSYFGDGCWEPDILELPDGRIQLYFANEFPYQSSGEQEISMIELMSDGCTWSPKKRISFRSGGRDGMPSPLLLNDGKTLVVAIEDISRINNVTTFRPAIVATDINNPWPGTVMPGNTNRWFALSSLAAHTDNYSGAPQIRQLSTGETVLSYLSTWGRANLSVDNNDQNADMVVTIGNSQARSFGKKSKPFNLPTTKVTDAEGSIYYTGLWGSVHVLPNDEVLAMTQSNYHSDGSHHRWGGVYVIKGTKLGDIISYKTDDRKSTEIFIGAYSPSQARITTSWDNSFFIFNAIVTDNSNLPDSSVKLSDGISFFSDKNNRNALDSDVYAFHINREGLIVKERGAQSSWITDSFSGIVVTSHELSDGYSLKVKIPWSQLGGIPPVASGWGVNFMLRDKIPNETFTELISGNELNRPSTWCRIDLKE